MIYNSIFINKFSDLIKKDYDTINKNISNSINIDDYDLLIKNFDFFIKLNSINNYKLYYTSDYKSLKYIEDNIKDKVNYKLALNNDFLCKDRSYIDIDYFKKSELVIPFVYSLWDTKVTNDFYVSGYDSIENSKPLIINSFETMKLEDLKRIKNKINEINKEICIYNDLQKIILISNIIQNKVQYVDYNNISENKYGKYITESKNIVVGNNTHSFINVLFNNFGVCEGISNLTTALLNNKDVNINCQSILGKNHVWNIVFLNDEFYYIDNTWNITRNKNKYKDSLKAKCFSYDYLLFGDKTNNSLEGHEIKSICPYSSEYDFNKKLIENEINKLSNNYSFNNYEPPIFKSKFINKSK